MASVAERLDLRQSLIGERGLLPGTAVVFESPSVIKPKPDSPTVVRPADFRIGRVEAGFNGEVPDYLLYINDTGVSGDGPTTQASQVSEGLKKISEFGGIPLGYLGPKNGTADFADPQFTGSLPPQIGEIPTGATSHPGKYMVLTQAMEKTLRTLADQSKRKIFAVTTGYTAHVSFAVKEAVARINQELNTKSANGRLQVKLVNQDSSFPNTDEPDYEVNEEGFPLGRFYTPAYASNKDVQIWFLTNNWLFFNVKWARSRAPAGSLVAATSFPYTPEYVRNWSNWRSVDKQTARQHLVDMTHDTHPALSKALKNDALFVPLLANAEYFNQNTPWLKPEYYQEMGIGSYKLIAALTEASKAVGKRIIVSGVSPFVDMAKNHRIPEVFDIEDWNNGRQIGVFLARAPRIKQPLYGNYYRSADVAVTRTTQANSSAELVMAGVPQIVLTMPTSFMHADRMDRGAYINGLRQYTPAVDSSKLAHRFAEAFNNPGEAESLVDTADRFFLENHYDPGTNYHAVVAHLAGFPIRR